MTVEYHTRSNICLLNSHWKQNKTVEERKKAEAGEEEGRRKKKKKRTSGAELCQAHAQVD